MPEVGRVVRRDAADVEPRRRALGRGRRPARRWRESCRRSGRGAGGPGQGAGRSARARTACGEPSQACRPGPGHRAPLEVPLVTRPRDAGPGRPADAGHGPLRAAPARRRPLGAAGPRGARRRGTVLAALLVAACVLLPGRSSVRSTARGARRRRALRPARGTPAAAYAFSSVLDGRPGAVEPVRAGALDGQPGRRARAAALDVLRSAVARVAAASGTSWRYVGPTSTRPSSAVLPRSARASYPPVVLGWTDGSSDLLRGQPHGCARHDAHGVVRRAASRRHKVAALRSAVVAFDRRDRLPLHGPVSWEAVALHELGHVMGLAHVADRRQLMATVLPRTAGACRRATAPGSCGSAERPGACASRPEGAVQQAAQKGGQGMAGQSSLGWGWRPVLSSRSTRRTVARTSRHGEQRVQRLAERALELRAQRRQHLDGLVGQPLAAPLPQQRAQLVLGREADAVVDALHPAVLARQQVAALAVGVVDDGVEDGHAAQVGVVAAGQRGKVDRLVDVAPTAGTCPGRRARRAGPSAGRRPSRWPR